MNENQKENIVFIKDLGSLYTSKTKKYKVRYGQYKCFCGKKFRAQYVEVKKGHYQSCGCLRSIRHGGTKHGLTKHRLYSTWMSMIHRCHNPKRNGYETYGACGISVCERWHDVRNFIEDMYPTFKEGLMLDRINNNGNYEPSNCRWTTMTVQGRNTRILYAHNTTGYRGVSVRTGTGKFYARIKVNGKNIFIKNCESAIEAAKAYDQYVIDNNLEHSRNFK